MATMDDNPGPGRLLDKYVYQVIGKCIEKCAGRIALRSLTADVIVRRIMSVKEHHWVYTDFPMPIASCVAYLMNGSYGKDVVEGYRRLVVQTRY